MRTLLIPGLFFMAISAAHSGEISSQPEEPRPVRDYSSALIVCAGVESGTKGLKAFTLELSLQGDAPSSLHKTLETLVASELKAAGADVVLRGHPRAASIKSYLLLTLRAYKSTDGTQCAWGVDVDLHQPVTLERDPRIHPSNALTWHVGRQGIVACSELNATVRLNTLDLAQQFAWVYKHDNE